VSVEGSSHISTELPAGDVVPLLLSVALCLRQVFGVGGDFTLERENCPGRVVLLSI
jgi:hypothetical protein